MSEQPTVKFRFNNSELWGGLIGLALGIFVIRSGLKLKLGTINDPGSGYVLFYTGILMCAFAATIIVAVSPITSQVRRSLRAWFSPRNTCSCGEVRSVI